MHFEFFSFLSKMEVVPEETSSEAEEIEAEHTLKSPTNDTRLYRAYFPGAVRQKAYKFDGLGSYFTKEWDLKEGRGREFCWYIVELPKGNHKLSLSARYPY